MPRIENIHQVIFAAASSVGALEMSAVHSCETTHCIAGWTTTKAGPDGLALEALVGFDLAAKLIYSKSDQSLKAAPNFYASNEKAILGMYAANFTAEKIADILDLSTDYVQEVLKSKNV